MPSVAQLQKALSLDPDDAFLHYALAQELAKAGVRGGGAAEAVAAYDRCLAIDPAYCYAYFHKAKVLETLGRLADAKATLAVGVVKARESGDAKALGEIAAYLDSLD